jgi:hypothetical protein
MISSVPRPGQIFAARRRSIAAVSIATSTFFLRSNDCEGAITRPHAWGIWINSLGLLETRQRLRIGTWFLPWNYSKLKHSSVRLNRAPQGPLVIAIQSSIDYPQKQNSVARILQTTSMMLRLLKVSECEDGQALAGAYPQARLALHGSQTWLSCE